MHAGSFYAIDLPASAHTETTSYLQLANWLTVLHQQRVQQKCMDYWAPHCSTKTLQNMLKSSDSDACGWRMIQTIYDFVFTIDRHPAFVPARLQLLHRMQWFSTHTQSWF